MAQLKRTGATGTVHGVGHVRKDTIHTVPDDLVKDLLATGEWAEPDQAQEPERVTEPAPSQPAAKKENQPEEAVRGYLPGSSGRRCVSTMTRSKASIVSRTAVREPYRFTRTPVAFSTPMISMLPPPLSWMVQLFGMCRSRAARISRL